MLELLTVLLPLVIASALVPIQLAITLLLVRTSLRSATFWVAGMTLARLAQAAFVVLLVSAGVAQLGLPGGPSEFVSYLYLAVASIFYLAAAQQVVRPGALKTEAPGWLTKAQSPSPAIAFGWGAAYLTLSVKSATLNMTGVAVIWQSSSVEFQLMALLTFIALAEAGHIAIIAFSALAPDRAAVRMAAISTWLERHARAIVIGMGVVFGTWFLRTALEGLGWL